MLTCQFKFGNGTLCGTATQHLYCSGHVDAMTVKPGKDFDEETRVHMYLKQRIAQNQDGTVYLTRSNGRRRAGRPANYYLHRPEQFAKKFTAESDVEAIHNANWMIGVVV